jgi:thymidine kinase
VLNGYRFEVIVGCMTAGKSSELIRRIERARLACLPAVIFRPSMDTRFQDGKIQSRNGLQSQAIMVEKPQDMLKYSYHAVIVGIDEMQFFRKKSLRLRRHSSGSAKR